jgi:hypothetical protein
MGQSEEMKASFTYSKMPEELPTFMAVCKELDTQIRQQRVEKAAQDVGECVGFASPRRSPPLKTPKIALAGTVDGYTGPAQMDHSTGKRRIGAGKRAKRFVDGMGLYSGRFNHRVVECVA